MQQHYEAWQQYYAQVSQQQGQQPVINSKKNLKVLCFFLF